MKKLLLSLLMLVPLCLKAQEVNVDNSDTTVYFAVEISAEYPGGFNTLYADLVSGGMEYPPKAAALGIQGKVYVQFVIEKDGSIINAKVIRDQVGYGAGEEVVRALTNLKKFTPAQQGGRAVRTKFILPVAFQLHDSDPQQKDSDKESSRKRKNR